MGHSVQAGLVILTACMVSSGADNSLRPFARRVDYPTEKEPVSMIAADVNDDTHIDLITGNRGAASVSVLLGNGDGTFGTAANYPTPRGPASIVQGDFNGDTHLDLVIASFSSDLSLLLGNRDGRFQPFRIIGPSSFAVVANDFNGDRKLDVAYVRNEGLEILLGNGDATFRKGARYPVVHNTWNLWCGDLDGDGAADLVLASWESGLLTVMIGKGDGTFRQPMPHRVGPRPFGPIAADFNHDGKLDIALVNAGPTVDDSAAALLPGNGDGTFPQGSALPLRSTSWLGFMAAGDVDHDSNLDLVVSLGQTYILSGDGDGTFQQTTNYYTGPGATGVVLADFNHDDRLDLAVADNIYNRVGVLLNETEQPAQSKGPSPKLSSITKEAEAIATNSIANRISPIQYPPSPGQFSYKHWTTDNELLHNKILCMLQTKDGYLWLGTSEGLVRFDGHRFVSFTPLNTPEMKNPLCRALAEGPDGSLWIGTKDGLLRRKNGVFTHYDMAGEPDSNILSLFISRDGTLWVGTHKWFTRFKDETFRPVPLPAKDNAFHFFRSFIEDASGQMWLSPDGVKHYDFQNRNFVDALDQGRLQWGATAMYRDRTEALWFGDVWGGLSRWKNGELDTFHAADMLEKLPHGPGMIRGISEDDAGNLWLASDGGLYSFRDGDFLWYDQLHVPVYCQLWDREGNLWVGADNGLWRMTPKRIKTYTTAYGLNSNSVRSVCEGADGSVWIATESGINQYGGGRFIQHQNGPGILENRILTVYSDNEGKLWAGGMDGIFLEFRNGRLVLHPVPFGCDVRGLYQCRAGKLWLATGCGWWSSQNGVMLKQYYEPDGFLCHEMTNTFEDRTGNYWIGTKAGGLNRFKNEKLHECGPKEGVTGRNSTVLHQDESGALWIGSDDGLARYKDGMFVTLRKSQNLPDDLVMSFLEDDFGNYWIHCHHGIYRVSKEQLNQCADGRLKSVQPVLYGLADGMLSTEPNGPTSPNACKTRDGKMWFPTTKGLCVIDPKQALRAEVPPLVVLEQIKADGEVVFNNGAAAPGRKAWVSDSRSDIANSESKMAATAPSPTRLHFAPGHGRFLEVHFTANDFTAPEKVHFQYRLEGRDKDWLDGGNQSYAMLLDLPPGDYRFHVVATNHRKIVSQDKILFAFSIAPHFYQTRVFTAASAAGILVLGLGLHRSRLKRLRERHQLEHQASLAQERIRIAQDMHDDLGASLSKIALLSAVTLQNLNKPEVAQVQMEKIAGMAGNATDNISELVWVTNPKFDTLESLFAYMREYAAKHFDGTPIAAELDFPDEVPAHTLDAQFRRNLFLVLKEALSNIEKHAQASRVQVRLKLIGTRKAPSDIPTLPGIELTIEDNGRGFNESEVRRFGNGLANMRQRVSDLGGTFDLQTSPTQGTRLRVAVKLPKEG